MKLYKKELHEDSSKNFQMCLTEESHTGLERMIGPQGDLKVFKLLLYYFILE